jgi:branched-subunit amino acid ABC-type transport system permease component
MALGVAVGLVWALSRVAVPFLVKIAIDRGISAGDVGALTRWTLAVAAVGVVAAACAGGRRYIAEYLTITLASSALQELTGMVLFLLVLFIRPSGLFGSRGRVG